jgi:hypothetical protein
LPDVVLGQLGNRVQHALRALLRAIRKRSKPPRKLSDKTRS